MWLITNKGLLSVVEDRDDPKMFIVRARQDGLLEAMVEEAGFKARVWQDEYADYPFRAKMSRLDFTDLVYTQVLPIDYPNFKNSVADPKLDPDEAFFRSLPKKAFLDDGSLDPDYIQGI